MFYICSTTNITLIYYVLLKAPIDYYDKCMNMLYNVLLFVFLSTTILLALNLELVYTSTMYKY